MNTFQGWATPIGIVTHTTGVSGIPNQVNGPFPGLSCSVFNTGTQVYATIFSTEGGLYPNPFYYATDGTLFFQGPLSGYDLVSSLTIPATVAYPPVTIPAYPVAALPATSPALAGSLARVTDQSRSLWMEGTSQWFSLTAQTFNVKEFEATGDGVTNDQPFLDALNTIIAALANGGTMLFPSGTYRLSTALTLSANVSIVLLAGAQFSIDTGIGLTINSNNYSGPIAPHFTGAGTVTFANSKAGGNILRPEWWGALRDQSHDDGVAFNKLYTAAPEGFAAELSLGVYAISTPMICTKQGTLRGNNMIATGLDWRGGAGVMLTVTSAAANFEIADLSLDNHGTGTWAVDIECCRVDINRVYASPAVAFSAGVVELGILGTVFIVKLNGCEIASSSAAQTQPIGVYAGQGHSITLDDCIISGFSTACVRAGGAGGQSVIGFHVINSHIETFSGIGGPGAANAIGLDVVQVDSLGVSKTNFQMDGDGDPSASGQRAIKLSTVNGGSISGGNHFNGLGQLTAAIRIASVDCKDLVIEGNDFHNVNGYGVEKNGTGTLASCQIGINRCRTGTTASYDNSFTPTFTNLTVVLGAGAVAYSGEWQRSGNRIYFTVTVAATGGATTQSNAASTFFATTPTITPVLPDVNVAVDYTALASLGNGMTDTDGRFYPPPWSARTGTIIISGNYQVAT